jgi:hypothetical protein
MVGLYPVVTQPVYLVLLPMFSELKLKVGFNEALLNITAENLSEENVYHSMFKA